MFVKVIEKNNNEGLKLTPLGTPYLFIVSYLYL